jgi:hypothetical protein
LHQCLVERFAGDHSQSLWTRHKHGRTPKIEDAVVAHDVSEVALNKRRRIKARSAFRSGAERLWPVLVPRAYLPPRPLRAARPGASKDSRIQLFALRDLRRQMMGYGSVGCFHASQVSRDVRGYDEAGKLPGKKIKRDQRNRQEQKNRNHANKNVGDNQPVSQSPQHSGAQPAKAGNGKQNNRQSAEKNYPASKARRRCRTHVSRQPLHREQKHIQRQRVERRPRDPALRPETLVAQLALEFQRDQSHCVTRFAA